MSPIPGEPLEPKAPELTMPDGRRVKLRVPGLPQPKPERTEERAGAEPPRDDPRPGVNPHHVGF